MGTEMLCLPAAGAVADAAGAEVCHGELVGGFAHRRARLGFGDNGPRITVTILTRDHSSKGGNDSENRLHVEPTRTHDW